MCTFYNRVQDLCKIKGVSGSRVCLDLGLSKSTLSDIKSGRKKGVSTDTAKKFANYFGVSLEHLLGEEEIEKPTVQEDDGLTENQKVLIEFAKSLTEDQAVLALRLLKSLVEAD